MVSEFVYEKPERWGDIDLFACATGCTEQPTTTPDDAERCDTDLQEAKR